MGFLIKNIKYKINILSNTNNLGLIFYHDPVIIYEDLKKKSILILFSHYRIVGMYNLHTKFIYLRYFGHFIRITYAKNIYQLFKKFLFIKLIVSIIFLFLQLFLTIS